MRHAQKFKKSIKAFRIKKSEQEQERYGLLDSGATHNVREVKEDEEDHTLIPIEVEVAFNSEVKSQLFMTKSGTIVGPKGTETIISTHEAIAAGCNVQWKEEGVEVSKEDIILPVQIKGGTPVLPNNVCLELIEEIEKAKMTQTKTKKGDDTEFQLKDVWPQLRCALSC